MQEWLEKQGYAYPAMLMEGAAELLVNGNAHVSTDTIQMQVGQKLLR